MLSFEIVAQISIHVAWVLSTGLALSFLLQVTKVVPALTEEVKDALVKNIRRRMTPQPLKIRADIEMKCFQFDGVLHIKVLLFGSYIC